MFVISVLIFVIIQLPPGDYASWYVNKAKTFAGLTQEQAIELTVFIREKYGLDEPLVFQYINWIKNIIFHFDFGFSMHYNKSCRL
jgi:peptide/nickel transport system permease protein